MFLALFAVSLILSAAIAIGVARACMLPIDRVLHRIFGDGIGRHDWSKYFAFAIALTGITAGARIRALQEYIDAPLWTKDSISNSITKEFWIAEMYRTAADTLIGIAWLLLIFFFIALVANFLVSRTRKAQAETEPAAPPGVAATSAKGK